MVEPALRLLTIREVCERLQLSRATVYRLLEAGRLQSVKVGRCRRVPVESLERFLTELVGTTERGAA